MDAADDTVHAQWLLDDTAVAAPRRADPVHAVVEVPEPPHASDYAGIGSDDGAPDSHSFPRTFQERFSSMVEPVALGIFIRLAGDQFVDALPDHVSAQLRCLRWPTALSGLLSMIVYGVQLWCMCDAALLVWNEEFGQKCQVLKSWLISYCIAVVGLPCCSAFSLPLLTCCIGMGRLMRARSLLDCQHRAPGSCAFADVLVARTLVSLTLVPISAALTWFVQRRLEAIRLRWGQQGPALKEIIEFIAASPPPEVPCGTECAICLSDDAELLADWRELRCGHQFHMDCLRAWLERERRCPLCRLDLHPAYLVESSIAGATIV